MKQKKASILDYLYNAWCLIWFTGILLLLFPFMFLCIQIKPLNRYGTKLTNLWADGFFLFSGLWIKTEYRFKPDKNGQYIFVANHFSMLDVAVGMKLVRNYFSYMGKSSVKKIPLIGYLFSRLHIMVDRSDRNSRARSLRRSIAALDEGRSLFIMPEGGILSKNIPQMKTPFKDGAFSLAKEHNIPLVPITFLNNYKIMPEYFIYYGRPHVVVHPPVETNGKTMKELKDEVHAIIQGEIDNHLPNTI